VVRPPVLADELSISYTKLTAGDVTTLWVKRPLSVNQHGHWPTQSINQSNQISIAPYVASESEAHK